MDVSDGLAIDAQRMAHASSVGIEIDLEAIPLADGVSELANVASLDAATLAATGGDDYELLVAASADALSIAAGGGVPLTPIGRVVADPPGLRVLRDGRPIDLGAGGWVHDV